MSCRLHYNSPDDSSNALKLPDRAPGQDKVSINRPEIPALGIAAASVVASTGLTVVARPCAVLQEPKTVQRYKRPPSTTHICAVHIRLSSDASHNTIRARSCG